MSNNQKFGPDNWIHIVTNALANYVEEGGALAVCAQPDGLTVTFVGVLPDDWRINEKFRRLPVTAAEPEEGGGETAVTAGTP